ncbi:MAG: amidohydrolase family protein [Bacteroidia bacterium]|nr:amidohydrolase family protein [Bacteroidia bacterium]
MRTLLSSLLLLGTVLLPAQNKKAKWDVNNPPGNYKEIKINTNEGTWMNVDVSPDGKTLVFDMLGDIYVIPISGGKAKAIRSGLAWEVQPRFSPDGKWVSFTSDAGGGDNIWVMKPDGSQAKQVTKESFRLLNNSSWMPDGQYFVARKHFTSTRSLGAGEIWMYHISGGQGVQLTKRKNNQQDVNEPSVSPDGRYVYYSEDVYPGGYFQYNKDPNSQIFVVKRYDRNTGEITTITGGPGGACRPQVSRDGKKLAFIRRVRTETILYVHNLENGEEYPIFKKLSKDQQEAWTIFGCYTGFDWMPGDKEIVIWGQGKIWRVNAQNGDAKEIPFQVSTTHKVAETVRFKQKVFEDEIEVRVLRQLITSPDKQTLIFNAIGHLWKMEMPDGKPERLTEAEHFEYEPSFSPDGKSIVFTTWDDEKMGAMHIMDLASKSIKTLTNSPGIYRNPSFSPDGKQIVYRKEAGNTHQGYTYSKQPGIYIMKIDGGQPELLSKSGEYPVFGKNGKRVYFQTGGYLFGALKKAFKYIDLESKKEHTVFTSKYANRFVISPDNKWIAFNELFKVFIAPMPLHGKAIDLNGKTKAIPIAQVARDAGINLHWSADSKELHWTLGNQYFTDKLTDRFKFLEGAADKLPPMDSTGMKIELMMEADKPEGMVAFTNARIITMEGDEVIENGTVIVKDNLIEKVGPSDKIKVPKKARVYDLEGKTLMPGMIDTHAHLGAFRFGQSPKKHWQYYANLAYGVTTTHDPSSNTEMTFTQSEMVKTGLMVGPRIYSTGTILYGADGDFKAVINNLEDAKSALRRTAAYGAFSVKSYNQPRREQRQQVIEAARQLGIMVYPEGGSFFYHNMSMVADGHTSVEHNIPVAPLYKDVLDFWSQTGTANTPTLIVNYGGMNGEFYWYQKTNVWEKERLLSFTPRRIVDSRSRHRVMIPDEEYENGHILVSKSCNKLQKAGVDICTGGHGQLQGLGLHWELWMLEQGGMSNQEALKSATIRGAKYIGMEEEIGSIKAGKIADLIVIDGNPLVNIRETENVVYTMINGRLFDSSTMNEIGNYDKKRSKFYWELPGSGNAYPFFESTNSFMRPQCHCRQ